MRNPNVLTLSTLPQWLSLQSIAIDQGTMTKATIDKAMKEDLFPLEVIRFNIQKAYESAIKQGKANNARS